MPDDAEDALARWDRWVAEIEDRALDGFEYGALLDARSDLAELLPIAGRESLWDETDAIDVRFRDVTIEVVANPYSRPDRSGWWWTRLPASEESRRYLAGDY